MVGLRNERARRVSGLRAAIDCETSNNDLTRRFLHYLTGQFFEECSFPFDLLM